MWLSIRFEKALAKRDLGDHDRGAPVTSAGRRSPLGL